MSHSLCKDSQDSEEGISWKNSHSYKYIDDLCWINNGTPAAFLSPDQKMEPNNPFWIYPLTVLEIKCEVTKYVENNPEIGIHAHCMNLDISIHDLETQLCNYRLIKFDKRRNLPFAFTQYIKFHSNRPVRQSYTIAISQTVPILYLTNNVEDAAHEINILITTLVNNGFHKSRLHNMILHFIKNNQFPGVKFEMHTLIQTLK